MPYSVPGPELKDPAMLEGSLCAGSTQTTCSIQEDFLGVAILGWVSQDE